MTEAPSRDEAEPTAPSEPVAPVEPTTPPVEGAKPSRKAWTDFRSVKEKTVVDSFERLDIVAGVCEEKGSYLVFLAKATGENYARVFFSMPAHIWSKALPVLDKYAKSTGEIERKSMAEAVINELKRLKELGIDIADLVKKV